MSLTLETSQIFPSWALKPVYIPDQPVFIFPWKIQILFGLAWINYAAYRKDLFIYIQIIPALVTAVIYTLQWHPYLRKRIRRAHETSLTAGLTVLLVATVATSVSPFIDANVSRIGLGAIAGLATLAYAASTIREEIRMAFPTDGIFDRPTVMTFVVTGLGVVYGGAWAAYGFYGAQDPFIYVSFLVIAGSAIVSLLLKGYAAYRSGGLETGWDSQSEEEEFDQHVDRLNRANTRSSYAGSERSLPRSLSRRLPPQGAYDDATYSNNTSSGATIMQEVKYPSDEEVMNKA
ncbi:hypothetical protein BC829DRAFT_447090 [Chytridium lagenaria]|nr:hypothetical protein BC829DRAFT_447090 [Chytridium lagenaria]